MSVLLNTCFCFLFDTEKSHFCNMIIIVNEKWTYKETPKGRKLCLHQEILLLSVLFEKYIGLMQKFFCVIGKY